MIFRSHQLILTPATDLNCTLLSRIGAIIAWWLSIHCRPAFYTGRVWFSDSFSFPQQKLTWVIIIVPLMFSDQLCKWRGTSEHALFSLASQRVDKMKTTLLHILQLPIYSSITSCFILLVFFFFGEVLAFYFRLLSWIYVCTPVDSLPLFQDDFG
jgi:hypothetical protein